MSEPLGVPFGESRLRLVSTRCGQEPTLAGLHLARSAGFQTCCIADFKVGGAMEFGLPADLEIPDTADLEVCATLVAGCAELCCIASFQPARPFEVATPCRLAIGVTADWKTCATEQRFMGKFNLQDRTRIEAMNQASSSSSLVLVLDL